MTDKQTNAEAAGSNTFRNEEAPGVQGAKRRGDSDQQWSEFKQMLKQSQWKRCTVGVVIDLTNDSVRPLSKLIRNIDALKALAIARGLGKRYLVMAGYLMRPKAGALAIMLTDESTVTNLALAVSVATTRMADISDMTGWIMFVDDVTRAEIAAGMGGSK